MDRLVRIGTEHWTAVYGDLGLAKPALMVLVALAANGPLRQARLSEATHIDRASLVALLNDLEARDLARRAPDPDDRRAHAVSITPAGRRLLARAQRIQEADPFFDALSPEERRTLDDLLRRLIAAHEG